MAKLQAALTFLPGARLKSRAEGQEMVSMLFCLAAVVGLATAALTAGLPMLAPFVFTADRSLWPVMQSVAPQVCCLSCCLSCLHSDRCT